MDILGTKYTRLGVMTCEHVPSLSGTRAGRGGRGREGGEKEGIGTVATLVQPSHTALSQYPQN